MEILRKYNVASHVYIPIIKRGVVDFAVGADWTPAAGDVKISKDGAAAANIGTLPTAITMGNTAMWDFTFTGTELSAAKIMVTVSDSATKAVEDQMFIIATYGNASAEHAVDLDDSVRAGLTALPNAAAEAAGGLFTRGSGAGQINQNANGQVDSRTVAMANDVVTAAAVANAAIDAATFAAGAIDANAVATDAIGSAELAASAVDKIVNAVWDELTTEGRVASSYGQLLKDDINATISSRLAPTVAGRTLDVTVTGEAGIDLDNTAGTLAKGTDLTGFNDLDAAGVRAAVGLAAANLDTQLTAIDDFIDTEVAAIKAKTDNLPASPAATGDAMALTVAERGAVADKILGRTRAGGADGGRSVAECLALGRNKWAISAGVLTVYADDDITPLFTAAVTTAAGDPVTSVDPV